MDFTLRPATRADIPAITRIYAHAVRHGTASFELEPPDEREMARRQRALLDGGYPYLVTEAGGGTAHFAGMREEVLREPLRMTRPAQERAQQPLDEQLIWLITQMRRLHTPAIANVEGWARAE